MKRLNLNNETRKDKVQGVSEKNNKSQRSLKNVDNSFHLKKYLPYEHSLFKFKL